MSSRNSGLGKLSKVNVKYRENSEQYQKCLTFFGLDDSRVLQQTANVGINSGFRTMNVTQEVRREAPKETSMTYATLVNRDDEIRRRDELIKQVQAGSTDEHIFQEIHHINKRLSQQLHVTEVDAEFDDRLESVSERSFGGGSAIYGGKVLSDSVFENHSLSGSHIGGHVERSGSVLLGNEGFGEQFEIDTRGLGGRGGRGGQFESYDRGLGGRGGQFESYDRGLGGRDGRVERDGRGGQFERYESGVFGRQCGSERDFSVSSRASSHFNMLEDLKQIKAEEERQRFIRSKWLDDKSDRFSDVSSVKQTMTLKDIFDTHLNGFQPESWITEQWWERKSRTDPVFIGYLNSVGNHIRYINCGEEKIRCFNDYITAFKHAIQVRGKYSTSKTWAEISSHCSAFTDIANSLEFTSVKDIVHWTNKLYA